MTPTPDSNAEAKPAMAEPVDWPQVLSQHRSWLATVLRARGVEADAVDEVLQEVGIVALTGGDRLRDPTKVAPWLYRVTVVSALQYRRRMGRRRKQAERYRQVAATMPDRSEPDPLDWLVADEQRELVRQALAVLSPKDAEIMLLKYTEGWSYRQLADQLGISVSAIEARLHRARERMRVALARVAPELVPR